MESLEEIVKERKIKMHQKESKLFNSNYDQIIKHTMQNRVLNVEKSINPPPDSFNTQSDEFQSNQLQI